MYRELEFTITRIFKTIQTNYARTMHSEFAIIFWTRQDS